MKVELDEEVFRTLLALAAEENVDEKACLQSMIKKIDSERHVVWNRRDQKFARGRCRFPNCRELS